jgi:hypothetical protein
MRNSVGRFIIGEGVDFAGDAHWPKPVWPRRRRSNKPGARAYLQEPSCRSVIERRPPRDRG